VTVTDDPDDDGFEERWGSRVGSQHYDLRPRRQSKYTTDHLLMSSNCFPTLHTAFLFPQMNATTAIRRHGQRALDAVYKEVKQLDAMNALHPVHKWKGDHAPLECLVHVAEKRDKSLKGRACADGRVQRNYIGKE